MKTIAIEQQLTVAMKVREMKQTNRNWSNS